MPPVLLTGEELSSLNELRCIGNERMVFRKFDGYRIGFIWFMCVVVGHNSHILGMILNLLTSPRFSNSDGAGIADPNGV